MAWLGLIVLVLLVAATQELFLETHRHRYGRWRSTRERLLWASADERRMMWAAATHRDTDLRVELSRLFLWTVVVLFAVGAVSILASGGLAPRR